MILFTRQLICFIHTYIRKIILQTKKYLLFQLDELFQVINIDRELAIDDMTVVINYYRGFKLN